MTLAHPSDDDDAQAPVSTRSTRREDADREPTDDVTIAGRLIAAAAAAAVLLAFFLPWMDGAGPFDQRAFSGFDFARLIRNFEITTDTTSSFAQVRGTAIAIYLAPALAANAAAIAVAAPVAGFSGRFVRWCLSGAALYVLALHGLIFLMSAAPMNEFSDAVGLPREGTLLAVGGAATMWFSARRRHSP